jgi:hypothetical protein
MLHQRFDSRQCVSTTTSACPPARMVISYSGLIAPDRRTAERQARTGCSSMAPVAMRKWPGKPSLKPSTGRLAGAAFTLTP